MTSQQNSVCWFDINGSDCVCPKCYGCRRKKPRTQAEAQEEAVRLNEPKNRGRRIARVKAYDCPWCEDWHVGHDNKLKPLWKQDRSKNGRRS